MTTTETHPGDIGHHHVPPGSPHYVAAWHRGCCEPVAHTDRAAALRLALDEAERGGAAVVRIEDVRVIVGGGE